VRQLPDNGVAGTLTVAERGPPRLVAGLGKQSSGPISDIGAVRTLRTQEDMRHPPHIWTDSSNATYPLPKLREAYSEHLAGRTQPASPPTIRKYNDAIQSFERSLELHGEAAVLENVTPFAVERWFVDLRAGRLPSARLGRATSPPAREDTIASLLAALKAFSRKYVYRHLEMSQRDLLERVERYSPSPPVKVGLNQDQIEQVLGCYDSNSYEDVRDRALIAFYAATGLRFWEVMRLTTEAVDPYAGWVKTIGKGRRERQVRLGERACKYLRGYLRLRSANAGVEALWTSRYGKALTYAGGQDVFRRLKKRSGIAIANCHRFRHTWAQTALRKGAERGLVQDAMGWQSDAMLRRYGGWVRTQMAAEAMPRYAPI
jgi:integrase/recombinase XerD